MRAVEHRVVLVDRGVRLLAPQHQARHLGGPAAALREQLVEAGAGADLAARGERRSREEVPGLRAVDVPLLRLGVVEPADEEHPLAEVGERCEHLPQLQLPPFAPGPPLLRMEAVPREEHRQPDRSLARLRAPARLVRPDPQRLEPGQGHADPEATEHRTAGEPGLGHGGLQRLQGTAFTRHCTRIPVHGSREIAGCGRSPRRAIPGDIHSLSGPPSSRRGEAHRQVAPPGPGHSPGAYGRTA